MTTPEEIKKLAWQRVDEAYVLFENGKFDGAFYLAGYSVELMLKAKTCERLGIPNLFDEKNKDVNAIEGVGEVRKALKTHNLFILLIYSGLKNKFDADKSADKTLIKVNSLLFGNWDENARYKPCGYMKESDVNVLINLLKDHENGLLSWIEKN